MLGVALGLCALFLSRRWALPSPSLPPSPARALPHILVAHEQHLQAVGSDRRLLSLIDQLSSRGVVSLLFRKPAPASRRSPSTASLARMIGAASPRAHQLRLGEKPPLPPAIYELGPTPSLISLLRTARFDLILIGLWFWWEATLSLAGLGSG